MVLTFEDRPSDSPFIERVWRSRSEAGGAFLSIAQANLELVVSRTPGQTLVIVRGPETRPSLSPVPANGRWFGVRFALGVHMLRWPTTALLDHSSLILPVSYDGRFWLDGAAWDLPSYDDAEVFVDRLARRGVIARDPVVAAVLEGDRDAATRRSVQRHFLQATGMTHTALRQIQRARFAADLLRAGAPILDAVFEAGYFDQAHLTRSLRGLIGQTPARIARREAQLSFLYKTDPPALV
jgi:hypothetical protein